MSIMAQRILQRRKLLSLSQEELAYRIGTSQRQISHYERGENEPTARVLDALAEALETSADWLLGRTDIPERPLRGQGDLNDLEVEIVQTVRKKPKETQFKILEVVKLM